MSPATKRKTPQQKRTTLRNKADKLWSLIIRTKYQECQRCGHDGSQWVIQAAHIIGRSYRNIRWVEANGTGLCLRCHKWGTEHPLEWEDWVYENIGRTEYAMLRDRALFGPVPLDYPELIPRLQARLAALNSDSTKGAGDG